MSIEQATRELVREEIRAALAERDGRPLLMSRREAAVLLGVSLSTFDAARADPGFPQPIYPPGAVRLPRWRYADLCSWVERQPGGAE